MPKDYKVEMKPTYWHVTLSSGAYSDYAEVSLFFAGNDEDEIWNFLCRYIDDVAEESEYLSGVEYNEKIALAIKYYDKKFISNKYTGDRDIDWSSPYKAAMVAINRLDIIYFNI